jgi:biotin synthase-like enzyme
MNPRRREGTCEVGPIRPPSEASSLLIRVTRNCPWNKCAFCAVYKREKFSKRSQEDILSEIDLLADAARRVRERAGVATGAPKIPSDAFMSVVHDPASDYDEQRIAMWLMRGGRSIFLQDADSLVRPAHKVAEILDALMRAFPHVERITTYARSRTLTARSPEQLAQLREAGLTRIHVGVESGSDAVLARIDKGCRAEHHVTGCRRAVEAGFHVCCYVMPGLGGVDLSEEHAVESARVLMAVDPHRVRLRTLWIDRGSPLEELHRQGAFRLLEEDAVVEEIRTMVRGLKGASGRLVSDHDRNLLSDLEGHLTEDAPLLDAHLATFLDLPRETKDAFVVARRSGYFRNLDFFLADAQAIAEFTRVAADLRAAGDGSLIEGMTARLGRRSI